MFLAGMLFLSGCVTGHSASITPEEKNIYGLQSDRPHWKYQSEDGLTFILERLYPDMVRGFFIARGFNLDAANRYAGACVYKSVLRNTASSGVLHVQLKDWSIEVNGKKMHYMIEPDWQNEWQRLSVRKSARIAFEWSQFRPVQTFSPGDWLQGMSNVDLKPDTHFNINLVWTRDGKVHHGVLKNVYCGPPEVISN